MQLNYFSAEEILWNCDMKIDPAPRRYLKLSKHFNYKRILRKVLHNSFLYNHTMPSFGIVFWFDMEVHILEIQSFISDLNISHQHTTCIELMFWYDSIFHLTPDISFAIVNHSLTLYIPSVFSTLSPDWIGKPDDERFLCTYHWKMYERRLKLVVWYA